MLVRIVPVGNVNPKVIESVVGALHSELGLRSRVLLSLSIPRETFNQWRKQYNAEQILSILTKKSAGAFIDKELPTLFITDADIYYDKLNYVFGLEDPTTASSIVSIARLRAEFYDQAPNLYTLCERTAKEAVHELGHHIGFDHCQHSFCVMSFSPSVGHVDDKRSEFCSSCKIKASMRGIEI